MLETSERLAHLDRLGIPEAGRRIVLDAVKYEPVRKVASRGGGNVITSYQSRKMQRQIDTESRHFEFQAGVGHEYDPTAFEYYGQPGRFRIEVIDEQGEIHSIDHTPDFLVLSADRIVVEEWKPWARMVGLARRNPWRYELDPDDVWRSPCIEKWFATRGIEYRIRTDRDIPYRRRDNFIHLEDYRKLKSLCDEAGVKPPSFPTLAFQWDPQHVFAHQQKSSAEIATIDTSIEGGGRNVNAQVLFQGIRQVPVSPVFFLKPRLDQRTGALPPDLGDLIFRLRLARLIGLHRPAYRPCFHLGVFGDWVEIKSIMSHTKIGDLYLCPYVKKANHA